MFLCDHLGLYYIFYIYNYEMMMMGMREWGRAVVGERGSVNPWQYLHRFFLMSLSISGSGSGSGQPLQLVKEWQTGTLFNRTGVVPVRLNTVYALNRLHPTGLEPGPPALYLAELTSLPLIQYSLYAQDLLYVPVPLSSARQHPWYSADPNPVPPSQRRR